MPHSITLQAANTMILAFQNNPVTGVADCETFTGDAVRELLNQEGCVDFRIYHGLDNGLVHSILVGVDENGDDMENLILEDARRCPSYCPNASGLNS